MTSPAAQAPAPTIQNFSGLCRAVAGWLATNLPEAIRDTVVGFAIGYAGNVFLMLFLFDGYTKTQSGLATGTTTILSGSLTWGIGSAIVTSLWAYRRRVGKEQFWQDIRNLPALLGSLLKTDGRLGRVHLLSGACISLLTTCFVAPWASLVLAAGLLAIVPSALRAVLSNLLLSVWSSVANRFAPAHANPVGGAMAMTVGTLGAILALGVAFLVPSSLIKLAAAAVCGGLAWADNRRTPPSAAIWMSLVAAGAISGLFALLDPLTALAHDGGWSENHRSLITWWNSAGSTPLLGFGLIGGVAAGVGSAIGSAIGSVLAGGPSDYTPGVIYGTGSKEDPFRDYKDAAHPPWMAPYGDGSPENPYSDTPLPVIDTSPTPDSPAGESPGPADQPTATDGPASGPGEPATQGQAPTSGATGATPTSGGPTTSEPTGPVTPPPIPQGPVTPPPISTGPVAPPPLPPGPVTPPPSPIPPGPTGGQAPSDGKPTEGAYTAVKDVVGEIETEVERAQKYAAIIAKRMADLNTQAQTDPNAWTEGFWSNVGKDLRSIPGQIKDTAVAVGNTVVKVAGDVTHELKDPTNWTALHEAVVKTGEDIVEHPVDSAGKVATVVKDVGKAGFDVVKHIVTHPIDTLKQVIGLDNWQKVIDPNVPITERIGRALYGAVDVVANIAAVGEIAKGVKVVGAAAEAVKAAEALKAAEAARAAE